MWFPRKEEAGSSVRTWCVRGVHPPVSFQTKCPCLFPLFLFKSPLKTWPGHRDQETSQARAGGLVGRKEARVLGQLSLQSGGRQRQPLEVGALPSTMQSRYFPDTLLFF